MAITQGMPVREVWQNKDRRYERDAKLCGTTANAYMGSYGTTAVNTTDGILYSAGLSEIKNYSTGTDWLNVILYTNHTTGLFRIINYYTGTSSTYSYQPVSTASLVIPTSQFNLYRVPIYSSQMIDFNLSVSSAANTYYHLMVQEANGVF